MDPPEKESPAGSDEGLIIPKDRSARLGEEGSRPADQLAELLEEIARPDVRLTMLIGAAGTGKTTLVERLAAALAAETTVGIVDADIGQSHLGPPATVAWGRTTNIFPGWDAVPVEGFYFTGAVTPMGNLLQIVTGAVLMAAQARAVCGKVLMDTTGLIDGPPGRALKQMKIDALRPDLVLALERGDELRHITGAFEFQRLPRIISMPAPPGARCKTRAERAAWREERFRTCFKGARPVEIRLDRVALRFTRNGPEAPQKLEVPQYLEDLPKSLTGRLVSLRDRDNTDVALGVIESSDRPGALTVRTTLADVDTISTLVVGTITLPWPP